MATAAERETTVTVTDETPNVLIWSAQRKYITRLRKHPSFTETRSGYHEGTEWAQFSIPADQWNPASGAKRRQAPLSEERREALSSRMRDLRTLPGTPDPT